jgi:hypothetical protein
MVSISSDNDTNSTELDGEYASEHHPNVDMRMENDVDALDGIDVDCNINMERDGNNEAEEDEWTENQEEEEDKDQEEDKN